MYIYIYIYIYIHCLTQDFREIPYGPGKYIRTHLYTHTIIIIIMFIIIIISSSSIITAIIIIITICLLLLKVTGPQLHMSRPHENMVGVNMALAQYPQLTCKQLQCLMNAARTMFTPTMFSRRRMSSTSLRAIPSSSMVHRFCCSSKQFMGSHHRCDPLSEMSTFLCLCLGRGCAIYFRANNQPMTVTCIYS